MRGETKVVIVGMALLIALSLWIAENRVQRCMAAYPDRTYDQCDVTTAR